MPNYPHAAGRKNWDKHGESPSLLDFTGVVGDGVHDDATGIQNAINDTLASGGSRALRIPGGYTFLCGSPLSLPSGVLNLTIFGDGDGSIIKRGAAMPNGSGLFDIAGTGVTLRNFVIEGDVTTAAGVNYSAFSDPMDNLLTKNSSIWAHGGTADLLVDGVRIYHTGGYAVLLDATAGDIADVTVTGCRLRNNRPHLFGTSSLDLNYGSWTGGIHYQGNGTSHCVRNLSVTGCKFQRSTGNQVWGHAYAFTQMHENVRVTNNDFIDIGRDGVELGNTTGGVVAGNVGRRIGYIAVDDTSAALPKYLAGQYAVFIDTSGTAGCDYTNNTCVSALGAFFDLDGFSYGRVSGNTCRVPSASDPEYTEDLISSWPGNYTYGVQTGNNYYAPGGTNVSICDNTFVNCGEGAIRLFAARGCHIAGNTINHPAAAAFAPIILGNFVPAMGGGQIDTVDCDIADNNIQWSPATALAAVQELENWGAGSMPWSGEVNWVADNKIFGANAFEFAKAVSSNSVAGFLISNAATPVSAVGYASTYADTAAVHLAVNGGAFAPVARVAGSAGHIQFNAASGVDLAGNSSFTWDDTGKILTVVGAAGGVVASTFNSSAMGATNALQTVGGTFYVTGAGNAGFQAVAVTGLVAAGSMTIAGAAVATQAWVTAGFIGGANIAYAANVLTLSGAGNGVVATTFNSSATGATNALQTVGGTFTITGAGAAAFQSVAVTGLVAAGSMTIAGAAVATQAWVTAAGFIAGANIVYAANVLTLTGTGNGVVATTFNSSATGSTNAIQTVGGTFSITGAGDAAFQSAAVTGLVAAGSMTIAGAAVATQAWVTSQSFLTSSSLTGYATETWVAAQGYLTSGIGGADISYASNVLTLTGSGNGVVATTFNSSATGATNAVQTVGGTFSITGAGAAAFQSVAATGLVAAGSMTIGGATVATQSWVTGQSYTTLSAVAAVGYLTGSVMSGYANLAAAVTDAENYGQGQLFSALVSHLASYHGAATSHTHTVTVGGTAYTTSATDGTP